MRKQKKNNNRQHDIETELAAIHIGTFSPVFIMYSIASCVSEKMISNECLFYVLFFEDGGEYSN